MLEPPSGPLPLWPAHLTQLCGELRAAGERRDHARAAAWMLLRDGLMRYLRGYARRVPTASREDLEDLASSKASDLLARAESGEWDPSGRHPAEVAGYLASVARNALLRHHERAARTTSLSGETVDGDPAGFEPPDPGAPPVEANVEASEFIERLRGCLDGLQPRARRVWFFRVLLDMSSRDIASHPAIALNPPHVDVVVKRARDAVRDCLRSRGYVARDLPLGAFTRLWDGLHAMSVMSVESMAGPRHDD